MRRIFASLLVCGLSFLAACVSADPQAKFAEAMGALEEGREAARNNELQRALSLFTQAVKLNPDLAEGFHERGKVYVRLRLDPKVEGDGRVNEQKALEDFSRAIAKNPAYADAYYNRAMVLCSRAQYKPAVEDLFNAVRFNARDPEPHLAMGQIYETKFEDKALDAFTHYEKYVDLGGTDPDTREKVRLWKEFNRKKEPVPPTVQSRKTTPEDEKKAADLYAKARDLLLRPDKSEAVKAFEQLLLDFGHTKFVQDNGLAIKTAIITFKKKDAPK